MAFAAGAGDETISKATTYIDSSIQAATIKQSSTKSSAAKHRSKGSVKKAADLMAVAESGQRIKRYLSSDAEQP